MTTAHETNSMTLSVTNFGPIAEATLDLRPLSVFIGPSNTGKSYMAVLIYALHKFLESYSSNLRLPAQFLHRQPVATGGRLSVRVENQDLSHIDVESLLDWAGEMNLDRPDQRSRTLPESELPESISRLIRPILRGIGQYSRALDEEVARCFGIEESASLIRYPGVGETQVTLSLNSLTEFYGNSPFRHEIRLSADGVNIDAHIPEDIPLWVSQNIRAGYIAPQSWRIQRELNTEANLLRSAAGLIGNLSSAIISSMVDPVAGAAYYLPADRAGVMHAHRVVVRSLIARASRGGLRPEPPLPVLSGVLGDFLEQLIDMTGYDTGGYAPDIERRMDDPSTRLENTILHGSVLLEQGDMGYPSFVYRPGTWDRDLPLMNASSMISEMAPVVLYLRHLVGPGDLLIIEEPESHLHPEMQVAFTRELASMVKAGIRVIITTHSEWVLEELANLVLLSELPEESRTGIPGSEVALTPNEIGAWLFNPSSVTSGSVVEEIHLDKESGTFPARYGVVTEDLYNRFATISNRIIEEAQCHQRS